MIFARDEFAVVLLNLCYQNWAFPASIKCMAYNSVKIDSV